MWCGGNCSGAYEKEEVKKEREEGGGALSREIASLLALLAMTRKEGDCHGDDVASQ